MRRKFCKTLSRESKTTGLFKVVGLEHEYMGKSFKALAVKVGEIRKKKEEEEEGGGEEERGGRGGEIQSCLSQDFV